MKNLIIGLLAFFLLLTNAPAWAASSTWEKDGAVAARLISATEDSGTTESLLLGLEIQLADGWHSYWRSPGETGLPPELAWDDSENLDSATLRYPIPIRMNEQGIETIGYKGRVLFPVQAKIKETGKPVRLALRLQLLVCADLCVPQTFSLKLNLPAGGGSHGIEAPILDKALEQLPQPPDKASFSLTRQTRQDRHISLTFKGEKVFVSPDLLLETTQGHLFVVNPPIKQGKHVTFHAQLTSPLREGEVFENLPITATLIDGQEALEVSLSASHPQPNGSVLSFAALLCLALLGGFILNLMPCVLPVLSLKIFSLLKQSGRDHRHIRQSFLSTAAGILFSFTVLAGLTVGLKASGQAFGWGVQFQHPLFLAFLLLILTFFACNLFGFFEITLPSFIAKAIDPSHHPKLAGDFATGALATLLATPCSAPFLGTAVAFALGAGTLSIFFVFWALGLGLALPYLLIALRPSWAALLPRPGAWMLVLSRLLGFGLLLTAGWLLTVLGAQIGLSATAWITAFLIALGALLALRHRGYIRRLTVPLLLILLSGIFLTAHLSLPPRDLSPRHGLWKPFDEEALARHLREGKTVFIDVTADWCLTCKINKRFTLQRAEVKNRLFNTPDVISLQADWTNPDPSIDAFLQRHQRYGIPFNVVYGPRAPEGIVLPEILTPSTVLDALDKASFPASKPKSCPVEWPVGAPC